MSPFDPFRGGRQKGTMSPFFTVFFTEERPLDAFLRKEVGEMYPGFRGDAKEEAGFYIRIFCYQMYAIWANAK